MVSKDMHKPLHTHWKGNAISKGTNEEHRRVPTTRLSHNGCNKRWNNGKKNEHAASHIVLVGYGALEHKMNMHVRKAVDTACRSTLANAKVCFDIQKLVLELTQSIQHTGTRTVHEVREKHTADRALDPTNIREMFSDISDPGPGSPPPRAPPHNYTPSRGVATGPRT